ncbi:Na+/H+ antiporter subunit A [Aquibacillus koreensis]|uniref:Na+/H+ antiporter subunit A n=1 Tax=Aquibacillus koreensis TaxID=279446 RepID=A0A9X3WME1_9BACI|nr:Na+/H+ antiporter subunit A [Aquibacillus koreensis]MCT2538195.1 Na+/H+ antiporter subunit A [Aquibacillus koreensis]MDC3420861.1 Na+/H+ antiporter subunit A [Aquibacillus koreensis]
MSILHIAILAPFIFAIFIPLFYKYLPRIHTGWFVLVLPTLLFIYLIRMLPTISKGEVITKQFEWVPSLGINFNVYIDGLGLLFALLITGIGALVVLYSIYYLGKKGEALHNFYVYLLMFMGAMLGVVLSGNLMVLYVFWELTSLASALLIGYWYHRKKSRDGALKSMLVTVMGGFAMLAGFSFLYVITGTFNIQEIIANADVVAASSLFIPAMLLILLGAFTKSAQFPFHIWLPDAMEAPTPVSAYLHSATMVKAGIYLVARMSPVFAGAAEWFWLVAGLGIFTLLWGSFNAVRQTDLKSILAYSTISQLGMIMSLLGLGSASAYYGYEDYYVIATYAAIFHLINHSTFKGSLFMVVGIIDHETGTRDIRKLGGLITLMPITFTLSIIGAFSMAGIYPFNGFLSKEMFFTGLLHSLDITQFNMQSLAFLFPVIGWIASVFTFIYSMIIVFKTFTGKYQPEKLDKKPHEAPIGMLVPPIILAALVVVFGFFPGLLEHTIIDPAVHAIHPAALAAGEHFGIHIYPWHGWDAPELWMTIGVIALGVIMYLTLTKWQKIYEFLRLHKKDPINYIYDYLLDGVIRFAKKVTSMQMTGLLRDYLAFMFIFVIAIVLYSVIRYDVFSIDTGNMEGIPFYFWIIAFVFAAATITVPFIQYRVAAIIAVGIVGYLVALFFVIFRAPDLALTQLLVETVTTTLFLLCFYHLPELRKERSKPKFKLTNLIIAIGVGATVTITALSTLVARGHRPFEAISEYHLENSYKLAGGDNVVNVILVDFRGFDTFLEILVLGIASLGLYSLIKFRVKGRDSI